MPAECDGMLIVFRIIDLFISGIQDKYKHRNGDCEVDVGNISDTPINKIWKINLHSLRDCFWLFRPVLIMPHNSQH